MKQGSPLQQVLSPFPLIASTHHLSRISGQSLEQFQVIFREFRSPVDLMTVFSKDKRVAKMLFSTIKPRCFQRGLQCPHLKSQVDPPVPEVEMLIILPSQLKP